MIKYEDLVSNLEKSVKTICEHVGLEFHDDICKYYEKKTYIRKQKENENVNSAPSKEITEKWIKELSKREIAIIETCAKEQMQYFEYDFRENGIEFLPFEKTYYRLHQAIIGEIQIQYRLKVESPLRRLKNRLGIGTK